MFVTSRLSFLFSLFSVAITGVIIGILFLVFTKQPFDFDANDPKPLQSGLVLVPDGFYVNSTSNVSVVNHNLFPVLIENITSTGTHPLYNGTIGSGSLTSIWVGPKSEVSFVFPFDFHYKRKHDTSKSYFNEITRNCTSAQKLYVLVETKVNYSIFIKTGTIDLDSKVIEAECPTF